MLSDNFRFFLSNISIPQLFQAFNKDDRKIILESIKEIEHNLNVDELSGSLFACSSDCEIRFSRLSPLFSMSMSVIYLTSLSIFLINSSAFSE